MPRTKKGKQPPAESAAEARDRRILAGLRLRLAEAEETLKAIRSGAVDALVVTGHHGDQVYTLKDADRPYRFIIEKMFEGAFTIRNDGLILYANKRFAAMLDVPLEELLGDNLFRRIEAPGFQEIKDLARNVGAKGISLNVELQRGSGGRLFAYLSLAPLKLNGARLLIGVVADMTESRLAQQEREKLAAVVSQAVDGVMVLDPGGTIVYVNPACNEITGYAESELIGRNAAEFRLAGLDSAREEIEKTGIWKGRVVGMMKDGKPLNLDISIAPMKSTASPTLANHIVIFRDVTYAVKLEERLRQMERTEALGRLAGGVAHDLNNILLPIILNAELLQSDKAAGTPERRMIDNILQAAYRQRDLVQRILSFTRSAKGVRLPFSMKGVVEEALKLLQPSLPSSVEVRFSERSSADIVLGDEAELHELVANLCSNAADAMAAAGGVLEISLEDAVLVKDDPILELKSGDYLKLSVKDTGCGIPLCDMPHIFDPFFTTKAGKRTGIGLSIVNGIVKNHGGAITVESRPEIGTVFGVFLPKSGEKISRSPIPSSRRPVDPDLRILLVDDEDIVLETMRRAIVSFGYHPTAINEATGALALFRASPHLFDLAIIDRSMPHMSGIELAAQIRRLNPGIPILLATGYSRMVDEKSLRAAGINEVIMKPLNLKDLQAAIHRAVASGGGPDEPSD